jgi:hypothetical protein
MPDFAIIKEHMEVIGSDGRHVGTVDCVQAHNIILTKSDPASGGRHHGIPLDWVGTIGQEVLRLNQPAQQAQANWINNVQPDNRTLDRRSFRDKLRNRSRAFYRGGPRRGMTVTFPELALVAGTRAAAGVGIGLLLSNLIAPRRRRMIGIALLAAGAVSTIPIVKHLLSKGGRAR